MKKMKFFLKTGLKISLIALLAAMPAGAEPNLTLNHASPAQIAGQPKPDSTLKTIPTAQEEQNWQKFAGTWEGYNGSEIMRLGLTVDAGNKTIYGWHKAINNDGNRADMVSEDTMSISGNLATSATQLVNFIGGYNPSDRGIGTAKITLIDDNTIKWEIASREGTSYIPAEMELKKISPVATEGKHILFKNTWTVFDCETKKQFSLERPVNEIITTLGKAKSISVFLGGAAETGNIYHYDGLEVMAQNTAEGLVSYIYVNSDRFITPGNLKVGDSLEKVVSVYGMVDKTRKSENLEWHTYVLDNKKGIKNSFGVGIEDKAVKIIRISMLPSFK